MGSRAVAVCGGPEYYETYHSQWAGSDELIARVLDSRQVEPLVEFEWEPGGDVRWGELHGALDYLALDAVYRVSPQAVTVFVPLWFGFPTAPGLGVDPTVGELAEINRIETLHRLREQFRQWKAVLADKIACEEMSVREGQDLLRFLLHLHGYSLERGSEPE